MNRLISGLLGTATVTVSGRYPEELLNALTEQKITYWDTYRTGDRTIRLSILRRDFERMEKYHLENCFVTQRYEIIHNT